MGVAITLCNDTQHKRHKNKHHHSFLRRSEAESLPRFIQFWVPFQFLGCCSIEQKIDCMMHSNFSYVDPS
jgi:hypothetical protein